MLCIECHHLSSSIIAPIITAIGSLLTGIGAIILALWARKNYFKERESKTKLSIGLKNTNYEVGNSTKVYLDVTLKNEGKVDIRTFKRFEKGSDGKPKAVGFTWRDYAVDSTLHDNIEYSIELQVKRVKQNKIIALFDWFDPNQYETIKETEHINLLTDLEVQDLKDPGFYMEPNESYHLGCWLNLDKGLYEAKVIVVGEKKNLPDDFWHRRLPFEVK